MVAYRLACCGVSCGGVLDIVGWLCLVVPLVVLHPLARSVRPLFRADAAHALFPAVQQVRKTLERLVRREIYRYTYIHPFSVAASSCPQGHRGLLQPLPAGCHRVKERVTKTTTVHTHTRVRTIKGFIFTSRTCFWGVGGTRRTQQTH